MGKIKLSKQQKIQCNSIIHTASAAAGATGAGLAQVPLADAAIITPIQITMIVSLGAVFGVKVTEGVAKGIIASCGVAFIGRGLTQIVVGWIPGFGNIMGKAFYEADRIVRQLFVIGGVFCLETCRFVFLQLSNMWSPPSKGYKKYSPSWLYYEEQSLPARVPLLFS